jgi:nitrate/nitrite transporter NarK
MVSDGVRKEQHRALWLSTISFTICFAVWTIFSIIGLQIRKDLGLTTQAFAAGAIPLRSYGSKAMLTKPSRAALRQECLLNA